MRTILSNTLLPVMLLIIWSCSQKSNDDHHDHEGHDPDTHGAVEGGNQALYDEVMKVHDEVMPKMDHMYQLKGQLKEKIDNTPGMADDKKKEIEGKILQLDSASEGMMVWMRQFNPLPDSLGEEQAREYLEGEMEKIKKVRDDVRKALEEAEGAAH
ncbi:MAG TPA: hypothetical protein VF141_11845 [Chryseolinea sp.]